MASANASFKWSLIILSPMGLVVVILLNRMNIIQSNFYALKPVVSRLITRGNSSLFLSQRSELVFIGPSTVTLNPNMREDEADIEFFKFISKRHFACENSIRFGNVLDGGWDMCIAEPYRPQQPCLVYSFGINYDFSFDDAIAARFNCTVRSFDPSMKNVYNHRRSKHVWFYRLGIGGANFVNKYNWSLKTLPTIISSFNESDKVIDYLKIDVERSEWPSLVPMLTSGSMSKVKQFGVEIHVPKDAGPKDLYEKYLRLRQLEYAGFRRWHFARNFYGIRKTRTGFRSCCYEMVYINTGFIQA